MNISLFVISSIFKQLLFINLIKSKSIFFNFDNFSIKEVDSKEKFKISILYLSLAFKLFINNTKFISLITLLKDLLILKLLLPIFSFLYTNDKTESESYLI